MSCFVRECLVDSSLLVDIAAIRGSYRTPLDQGFVFGTRADGPSFHIRSALAWPITDPARMTTAHISSRIEHVCLTRKDFQCLGVWQLHSEGRDPPTPHVENSPYPLELHLKIESTVFDTIPPKGASPHPAHKTGTSEFCSSLELITSIHDGRHPRGLDDHIQVYCNDQPPHPLRWKLHADYPSFIMYESLFSMDKLHSNIATTLPTYTDDRTGYNDLDMRHLIAAVDAHQTKASELFLKNALGHVEECLLDVESHGDLLSNPKLDPVLLRQIQFCTSELASLKEKQHSEAAQRLLQVLHKAIHLAELSHGGAKRLHQIASDKKHKQSKRNRFGMPV